MKKILTALAAAGVLVAGGFTTAAISSPSAAVAQEAAEQTEDTTTDDVVRPDRGAILDEVLDELVADDVIDADQAAEIKAALEAKRDELHEQFGDRGPRGRGFRGGDRLGLSGFLDDGVIDADELAQLPEGHPLTDPEGPAAAYLEDGQLTQEELQEMHDEFAPSHGFGRRGFDGRGFGGRGFGAPAPSEEASTNA